MPIKEEQVVFKLNAMCRYDEAAQVHVGYLPRLQLFAQSRALEDLPEILRRTALQFIVACANKRILSSVIREGGLHPSTRTIAENLAEDGREFVAVKGYKECEEPIEVTVPLSLIAQQENAAVTA